MSGWTLDVDAAPVARAQAALVAVGVFADERPLRGGAGLVDWRLCGWLSQLLTDRAMSGDLDDPVLLPTEARLASPRLLVLGLGNRGEYDADRFRNRVAEAARQAIALGVSSVRLDLPEPRALPEASRAEALVEGLQDVRALEKGTLRILVGAEPEAAKQRRYELDRAATAHPRGGVAVPRRQTREVRSRRVPAGEAPPSRATDSPDGDAAAADGRSERDAPPPRLDCDRLDTSQVAGPRADLSP